VRSIVGRFLEHSRIFYFRNKLQHDVYLSSADWMNRNLFRRIEVAFPHQPTLGQVASLLLTGDDLEWDIRKASAWWFSQRDPGNAMSVYLKAVMAADLVVK
jgi:polyphosphate kinase